MGEKADVCVECSLTFLINKSNSSILEICGCACCYYPSNYIYIYNILESIVHAEIFRKAESFVRSE